jgi:hypothetical protein
MTSIRGSLALATAAAITLAGIGAGEAFAAYSRDFTLINDTNQAIVGMDTARLSDKYWTPFRNVYVSNGGSQEMNFDYGGSYGNGGCNLDLRVHFAGGREATFTNLNFCRIVSISIDVNNRGQVVASWDYAN